MEHGLDLWERRANVRDVVAAAPLAHRELALSAVRGPVHRPADVGGMALRAVERRMGWKVDGLAAGADRFARILLKLWYFSGDFKVRH